MDEGMEIKAEIPLNRWVQVVASFDGATGELSLWMNGEHTAYAHTVKRPFQELMPDRHPGIGIGNVEWPTPDNEPLNGMIADLRLYPVVLTPEEIGIRAGAVTQNPSPDQAPR